MAKKKLVYDEFMSWPYVEAYGMVPAPKVKKPRKPRKSRAKADWLVPDWAKRTHPVLLTDEFGQASSRVKRKVAKHLLKEVTDGTPRKRRKAKDKLVEQAHAPLRSSPLLEATPQGFQTTFVSCAMRECEE